MLKRRHLGPPVRFILLPDASCCQVQQEGKPQRTGWREAAGCLGSGTLLLLLPKCPICIAEWLAIWVGAGTAMPLAMHLHFALKLLFFAFATVWLTTWSIKRLQTH